MANSFDDLLDILQEPELKEAFKTAAEKYKEVKEYGLRQSDYSRKMNDLDREKKTLDSKIRVVDKWEEWKQQSWDDNLGMTKAEAELASKVKLLEAENQTLAQRMETDVTFDELQQEVDKMLSTKIKGVLTEDQFNQKYGSKLFNKDAYDKEVNERVINWVAGRDNMYLQLFNIGFKHKDEFGEVLDPGKVIEYANEHKKQNLEDAYSEMVASRRGERQAKDIEAKLAAAKEEGRKEAAQQQAMGQNGRMPTDSGAPEMGHLQERILRGSQKKEGEPSIPDGITMDGSQKLAHAVADIYRRDKANQAA